MKHVSGSVKNVLLHISISWLTVSKTAINILLQQYSDDESGLHYNRFRYYDPDTGQYISPDPIGLLGE
ncbi:RHS repeat-associated core domain-containing protein [Bombiscardovia apis]|uniref:RHS repeat-associated core domain-containing protein n=1 Tax=Bombiscardovia apis TaxID=2932182 RepID=UPI003CE4AEFB